MTAVPRPTALSTADLVHQSSVIVTNTPLGRPKYANAYKEPRNSISTGLKSLDPTQLGLDFSNTLIF